MTVFERRLLAALIVSLLALSCAALYLNRRNEVHLRVVHPGAVHAN